MGSAPFHSMFVAQKDLLVVRRRRPPRRRPGLRDRAARRQLWLALGLSNPVLTGDHVGMCDDEISIGDFPARAVDKIRYGDTDRQGHVNNAVFASFLETGRVELLHLAQHPVADDGCSFVIAHLGVDFRAELIWPGEVVIGTRVTKVGSSSIRLAQALFQGDTCNATAETVIVHVDQETKKSRQLSSTAVEYLTGLTGSSDESIREQAG